MQQNKHNENNKKLIAILTLLCFMFTLMPAAVFAENSGAITPTYDWYTSATGDAYEIGTVSDLAGFAKLTQGAVEGVTEAATNFADKNVKLTADLTFADNQYWFDDANGVDFRIKDFKGTFDGQTHTITGLKFKQYNALSGEAGEIGLFGTTAVGSNITNLTLTDVKADLVDGGRFASIAARLYGSASNCTVNGVTINAVNPNTEVWSAGAFGRVNANNSTNAVTVSSCTVSDMTMYATGAINVSGGVAGIVNSSVTMTGCSANNITIQTEKNVTASGGLVGRIQTASTSAPTCISGSTASNIKILAVTAGSYLGGFAGRSSDNGVAFSGCNANGVTINASYGGTNNAGLMFIGGFIGEPRHTSFTNCHVMGLDMTVNGGNDTREIGGFAGVMEQASSASNCSATGSITANCSTDGSGLGFVGGFMGSLGWYGGEARVEVTDCTANVNIVTNLPSAGGFVGESKPRDASGKSEDVTYTNCTATGNVTNTAGVAGGFSGRTMQGEFSGCSASGTVTAPTAGGFIGSIIPNNATSMTDDIVVSNCTASGAVTGTNVAGGFVGEIATKTGKADTSAAISDSSASGQVSCDNGIAGGFLGYGDSDGNTSITNCSATGTATGMIANDYAVTKEGVGGTSGNKQDILEADVRVTKKIGDKTYQIGYVADDNGVVKIGDSLFTASGKDDDGTCRIDGASVEIISKDEVLLTAPRLDHHTFEGWCNGEEDQKSLATTNSSYQWEAKSGETYHAHWLHSNYGELGDVLHKTFTMIRGTNTVDPEKYEVTFEPANDNADHEVTAVEQGNYFSSEIDTENQLKVIITPKSEIVSELAVGTYVDTIHVTVEDGSTHSITATLEVKEAETDTPSTNTGSTGGGFSGSYNYPVSAPNVDNGSATLSDSNATAGETVTATVKPDNGYGVAEVIVTDEKGNVIPVTYLGNGEYSFVMPAGKVNIDVEMKPAIILTVGSQIANVFGKIITIDAAPIITAEGRTMLPIRFIAEALGADVSWYEDTQTVTITKDGTVVEIIIGADYAYINGERVELDSPAFIANGRTYLPVRFVAEALGATVNWDAATQQVVIMK